MCLFRIGMVLVGLCLIATGLSAQDAGDAEGEPMEKVLYIHSELVDCVGVGPRQCMQVRESPDEEWLYFYDAIDGFTFVEGNAYTLLVRVTNVPNPPADASSLRYELIDVLAQDAVAQSGESGTEEGVEKILFVHPHLVDCEGVVPQQCMQVREATQSPWEFFFDVIEGFEHEVGYAYILRVRVSNIPNPPADGSSLRYELLEVLDQTQIDDRLSGTRWIVTDMMNENGLLRVQGAGEVSIVFEDGDISGQAPCNTFFGTYQYDGETLIIDEAMGMTRMACDEEFNAQEQLFFTLLPQVKRVIHGQNASLLLDEEGRVLFLLRQQ